MLYASSRKKMCIKNDQIYIANQIVLWKRCNLAHLQFQKGFHRGQVEVERKS